MAETSEFDALSPDQVHIEAIDAYHLGGNHYSASFELSDHNDEYFRSFLLEVDLGASLTFRIRQRIEDSILSHASLAPDRHVTLELGRRLHDLTPEGDRSTKLSGGTLFKLFRILGGPQYVIGDQGACHVRDVAEWVAVPPASTRMLNGIHGPTPDLVHACGNGGTLQRLRGLNWELLELPDQRDFNAIEVSSGGAVYLGGNGGSALSLRDGELVTLDAPQRDYFAIRSFKGRRYWGDANWGLNVQEGDALVPFQGLHYALSMHASQDKLVITGWKEVFVFDGETWDGFQLGYDGNIFLTRVDMADFGS
jgi:hypothetical protein